MLKDMVRKEILGFQPYLPGKPVAEVKRELGLKGEIIKIASNENPFGPPPAVLKAIRKCAAGLNIYPDGSCHTLRRALAKKHGMQPENIMVGSGTDEVIEIIAKTFFKPTDSIVVSAHAFIRYRMAGELMGSTVCTVPMKGFTHDLDAMAKTVNRSTKAVLIVNPNNPTGTYNSSSEVRAFLAQMKKKGNPLVVLDEAYYEYARCFAPDYPRAEELLRTYPHLIILRTFSKIRSLAGIRVGYALAHKDVIGYLDRVRPPFNVNSLAQSAALAALEDNAFTKRSLEAIVRGMRYLTGELNRLAVPFIPSAANFLLIDVAPRKGKDVFSTLLRKGLIIRSMDEYDYPNHIRVTIGTAPQNKKFIRELEKLLMN